MLLALASLAFATDLWRAPPHPPGPPALIVLAPGLSRTAALPLVEAVERRGFDAHVFAPGCGPGDAAAQASALVEAAANLPSDTPIVAHGFGATLAVLAADRLGPRRWVFLGPVLGARTDALTAELATAPLGAGLHLGAPAAWRGAPIVDQLVGSGLALDCVAPAFAADAQAWWRAGRVPVDLAAVRGPVWVGAAQLDLVAPPEVLVPAARLLPEARVVRLGLAGFDAHDYTHAGLLLEPGPTRAAARALGRP